jgi:hypothetical protein
MGRSSFSLAILLFLSLFLNSISGVVHKISIDAPSIVCEVESDENLGKYKKLQFKATFLSNIDVILPSYTFLKFSSYNAEPSSHNFPLRTYSGRAPPFSS